MKRLLIVLSVLSVFCAGAGLVSASPDRERPGRSPANAEYILLVGGPSMYQWEKYKAQPHDHWWANFVRAARIRTEQIRNAAGPDAKITWVIYKQGYLDRAKQDKQDLVALINTIRDKFNLNMVWFDQGQDVINYLNNGQNREAMKIADFEYFGHSNKACFMFDYSNHIDSACKSWLHENDLVKIHHGIFTSTPFIKSWGCHTGEQMSQRWYLATGTHMIGAVGKTQYMMEELPVLVSQTDKWVN